MPPDRDQFLDAIRLYPTGVTVVTATGPDGRSGMTANAVTSLSIDPPMMLACLDQGSRTLASVRAAGEFAINVLAAGQEDLARQFATKDPEEAKWEGAEWSEQDGIPRLAGALVWIHCRLHDLLDGGDHAILTGAVLDLEAGEGKPLIFHRGGYRDLID
jgi:3-hydroxy-9,10-secoandrosta-1,3,5(10)-triene-9,17-dione monooxygenase reductase component